MFQRLFGGSKKGDPNDMTPAEAIQRLSNVEELLNKKQEHIEAQIEAEKVNAIRLSKQGNKRGALLALKKKKKHEKTLLQLDGTLITLETQRESLQNASSNMEVLRAMKQAAGALQKSNQGLGVDDVHDLMDDLAEQQTTGKHLFLFKIRFYLIFCS
jgi:charged multivesicular body protein 4